MKEKLKFEKEYNDEISKNRLLRKIEESSLKMHSESTHLYLQQNKNCLSKIEIYSETYENNLPYTIIAEIEKQGNETEMPSEIEDILIKEGFKKIENKK
jgi:cupin superfamily acireductone dioxygenase involved in methionine salvage